MAALGRRLVRWRWPLILLWAVLGGLALVRATHAEYHLDAEGGSLHLTEASRVSRILDAKFSRQFGETFLVVLSGPAPFDGGRPQRVLADLIARLAAQPYVREVVSFASTADSTFLSKDRRTTFALLVLKVADPDSTKRLVAPVRTLVHQSVASLARGEGYRGIVTGNTPLDEDLLTVSRDDARRSEWRLIPLAGILLLLMLGSVVAALLPLLVGFLAIAISLSLIAAIATVTPMSIFVLNMTTMLGLAVGIDYSLLVVARYREELRRGASPHEAAARTVATAGWAVVTSGLTVALGFGALLFTPLIETRSIGLGGLVVVLVAVAMAVTLLPPLLAVLGHRLGAPRRLDHWYGSSSWWEGWARAVSRYPRLALTLGLGVIGLLTAPVFGMKIGLPARHWWPTQTEAGEGAEIASRLGALSYAIPLRVLVEVPEGRTAVEARSLRGLRALSDSLRTDPRVREVRSLVDLQPGTSLLEYSLLYSDLASARVHQPLVLDAYLSGDARVTVFDVVLRDTTSLTSAMGVVRTIRRVAAAPPPTLRGATILVGGYVAASVDFQDELLGRFPLVVALVFGATAAMLALAFRSVLIPLKAIILNTFSMTATFGLIVLVFQRGYGAGLFGLAGATSAVFVAVPVLVFAVVFGISMDYEVFLLSRIKEAWDATGSNEASTIQGLAATAGVISSAALLMIVVFGVFAFARVLLMQMLGFGLAVAVLLDATVIRMILAPAAMRLAGRWNWWPGTPIRAPGHPRRSAGKPDGA